MNRSQLAVMWTVGVTLSVILFSVGVGSPYLVNRQYEERKRIFAPVSKITIENLKTALEDSSKRVALEWLIEKVNAIDAQQRADPTTRYHFILGGVFPVLIVGACAFVTAGRVRGGRSRQVTT